jgi:hypothetical protein
VRIGVVLAGPMVVIAVMCMAETSTVPSLTPLLFTMSATSSVMRTNSCRFAVLNHR